MDDNLHYIRFTVPKNRDEFEYVVNDFKVLIILFQGKCPSLQALL